MRASSPRHTIVIVDQDVLGDRRVERVLEGAGPSSILDLRDWDRLPWPRRALDLLKAGKVVLSSLRDGLTRKERLGAELSPRFHPFAGLPACVRWTARAVAAARRLDQAASEAEEGALNVHANDLAAGLAVTLAKRQRSLPFVYDSHELQVHRHRRAGWLRVLVEHAQEQRVVETAAEVFTVNGAVAQAIQRLHPLLRDRPPRVLVNDFYAHRELANVPDSGRPALVYVGRATRGRQLERLAARATIAEFDVHGWLLGTDELHLPSQGAWRHGADYQAELDKVRREQRCLMWCCLDTRALSYRLATPNKLFQALAMGIPVLASPGTYLAELVDEHGIGAVDDGDVHALATRVRGPSYLEWVENIGRFRRELRAGHARI